MSSLSVLRAYFLPSARPLAGRARLLERLETLGIGVVTLETDDTAQPFASRVAPAYPLSLTEADIDAWRGHRTAWREIAAREEIGALVMTEQATLLSEFEQTLAFLQAHAAPQHYIRFPDLPTLESQAARRAVDGKIVLYRPEVIGRAAAGQFVGRDAAAQLLSQTETCDRPMAAYLQMRWVHGVEVLSLAPSGVIGGQSQSPSGLRDRLRLWLYHARIAKRARLSLPL